MVVMGVLTVTAIQSRNEAVSARNDAERQKTQAEDLIEFMLGDLRKKLEPVGRLDVLDSVGDRALRYFATLKPNELDADTLGRRARTLHMLGELEDLRGNLDKARAVFAEANESTDALLAQNSADPQRLFDHSQSIYWLGYIDWRRGEKKSAKKAFDQYRSMAEQLASVDPGNPRWRREQAYAYSNVGSLLFQGHEFSRARQSFEAALKVLTELAAQQPEDQLLQLDCARATSWLADSLKQVGLLDSARVQTMNELAIYERILAKDPLNSMVWENAVLSKLALARLDVEEGHLDRALVRLSDAEQGAQRLVKIEPENAAWLELSTKVQVETGETYLLTEQIGKAHEYISNALKLSESLFKQSPDVLDWQLSIMIRSNVLLARIYEKENKGKYAMGLLSSSINVLDKMKGVRADDSSIMWLKAQVLLVKGDVLMSLRDSKNARESWLLGLEEISAIANEATPSERIVQINLGQRSGAFPRDELLSMVQKLLAMGIRHPDLKLAMGRLILSKQ